MFEKYIEREIYRLINFDLFDLLKFHSEFLFERNKEDKLITKKSFWIMSEYLKKIANSFTKNNACFYFQKMFEFIESENFSIYEKDNKIEQNCLIIKHDKLLHRINPFQFLSKDWFNEKSYPEFESRTIFDLISIKKTLFYSQNYHSQDIKLKKSKVAKHKNYAFILRNKTFLTSKKSN